ncbi:MAG: peptidoglycan-associated lipoprotein Pal [Desulfuromonadaceae bacterium]|nr:peptidoglycan-associated lipoprotein Pal [Desulfuromonadaceae bacterium]
MNNSKISSLFLIGSLIFAVGGCSKGEIVKKDEPVTPPYAAAGSVKTESNYKGAATRNSTGKASAKTGTAGELLDPILGAAELKAVLKEIYFDFDAYTLTGKARDSLLINSEIMHNDPTLKIRIEGHCDERGSSEYNMALGEQRAKAAMRYLVTMGLSENRLSFVSFGKERPVAPGHDESSWAKNRRDEFIIKAE